MSSLMTFLFFLLGEQMKKKKGIPPLFTLRTTESTKALLIHTKSQISTLMQGHRSRPSLL